MPSYGGGGADREARVRILDLAPNSRVSEALLSILEVAPGKDWTPYSALS